MLAHGAVGMLKSSLDRAEEEDPEEEEEEALVDQIRGSLGRKEAAFTGPFGNRKVGPTSN